MRMVDLMNQVLRDVGWNESDIQDFHRKARMLIPNSKAEREIKVPDGIDPEIHYTSIKIVLLKSLVRFNTDDAYCERMRLKLAELAKRN